MAAPADARPLVEKLLRDAIDRRASDVHFEPTRDGVELKYRIDGQLHTAERLAGDTGQACINRLMVLGQLLTYRRDVPQESRFSLDAGEAGLLDLRLAVMPTTHGLRAVVRLPGELIQAHRLDELDLPEHARKLIDRYTHADAGMLLICGPAGSGKTTTTYAILEHIVATQAGLSVISLEDPVERDLEGVTQIEVTPFGELSYERALRSMLRQDPQVLALGEIRDKATASIAVQAALSGHRLLATLHAARPEAAVVRLLEMGIEPYQLASSLVGILAMRLLRRSDGAGGYRGRVPLVEAAHIDAEARQAILHGRDDAAIRIAFAGQGGFIAFGDLARRLIDQGLTDAAEVEGTLGPDLREA